MIWRSFHIVLLLLVPALVPSQSLEETFEQANRLFREGEFTEAAARYESILRQGMASAEVYYNLGNSYYRTGDLGKAILNYERAKVLAPGDADIQHNLDLANLRTLDRLDRVPEIFIVTWLRALGALLPFRILVTLLLASWVVLFLALAVLNVAGGRKIGSWMRWTVLGAGMLLVLLGGLVLVQMLEQSGHDDAIVLTRVVTVKTSPDPQSSDAFVIHEGLRLTLGDQVGEWVRITLSDGKVGWIRSTDCERI